MKINIELSRSYRGQTGHFQEKKEEPISLYTFFKIKKDTIKMEKIITYKVS